MKRLAFLAIMSAFAIAGFISAWWIVFSTLVLFLGHYIVFFGTWLYLFRRKRVTGNARVYRGKTIDI